MSKVSKNYCLRDSRGFFYFLIHPCNTKDAGTDAGSVSEGELLQRLPLSELMVIPEVRHIMLISVLYTYKQQY